NPSSLAFPATAVGATASLSVIARNNNSTPATINGITASGDYSQTNTCGGAIGASLTCDIRVTFAPMAQGLRSGQIAVSSSTSSKQQTIQLTGTGICLGGASTCPPPRRRAVTPPE